MSLLWAVLDLFFQYPHAWVANRELSTTRFTDDSVREWYRILAAGKDVAERSAIARSIYAAEVARIEMLRSKLDSQRGILTAVLPITTAVLGFAVADGNGLALSVAGVALLHISVAFMVALRGSAAEQVNLLTPAQFRQLLERGLAAEPAAAAVELAAADANVTRGIRLNNWLSCVQNSVVWSIIATALAVATVAPPYLVSAVQT